MSGLTLYATRDLAPAGQLYMAAPPPGYEPACHNSAAPPIGTNVLDKVCAQGDSFFGTVGYAPATDPTAGVTPDGTYGTVDVAVDASTRSAYGDICPQSGLSASWETGVCKRAPA